MRNRIFPVFAVLLLNLAVCLSAWGAAAPDRTNVCGHGAVPNDGLDDTVAINNAINAPTPTPAPGASPSRSIYFPPGTYIFKGLMTVQANTSYRFYGDGPGVATILFSTDAMNPTAGLNAPNMGQALLNVEGLTFKANNTNCGTAINASFSTGALNGKFRTASIHNVQIIGTHRDGTSGSWWTHGIRLTRASNSVIDKVHISGNKNSTQTGIALDSSTFPIVENTTGYELSNLEIKWCNSGLSTNGRNEGIYMTGFEFTSCGWGGMPAVRLHSPPGVAGGAIQLVNGRIDSIGNGLQMTNQFLIKVSNVSFNHNGPDTTHGTMLWINYDQAQAGMNFDSMVTECSFYGVSNLALSENGIFLTDAHSVRIAGNNFRNMQPGNGSCIVVYGNSSVVRITDNLFSNVRSQYFVQNPTPTDPYYLGNNP